MKSFANYTTNYTTISEIKQTKLFNAFYYQIEEGDPVLELINILEGLDLTEFKKMFQYKTKINPIRLLAVIIYAYSGKVKSLREIENYCNENIKFKYLLDGTKLEAYTNKYTFVWKKAVIKNKEKNKIKIIELISEFNSYYVIKKHTNC